MVKRTKLRWENAFSVIDPQINAEGIHLWPFDPSFAVDVRFYAYDKRHSIRMNRHDYFEVFYVHSGEMVCRIQDRKFHAGAGDLVVISSTQYHTMHPPLKPSRARQPLRAAALYFLPDLIRAAPGETNGEAAEYLLPFLVQGADFPHVIKSQTGIPQQVFDLTKRIAGELPASSDRARLAVKTYLKMILILLVNHYAAYRGTVEIFDRKRRAIERLRPLFEFLEARYDGPLTVQEAAAVVGRSKSDFMRLFKQVTGQSFINYVNHLRVAKAQELLSSSDLTISEVSQAVGFCDQSYFGSVFRKLVHMTPRQFKHHSQRAAGGSLPSA